MVRRVQHRILVLLILPTLAQGLDCTNITYISKQVSEKGAKWFGK